MVRELLPDLSEEEGLSTGDAREGRLPRAGGGPKPLPDLPDSLAGARGCDRRTPVPYAAN